MSNQVLTLTPPWRDVPIVGAPLPEIELPTNCPGCGVGLDKVELAQRAYVCECGHHFPMRGDAWVAMIGDRATFSERWSDVRPHDLLNWKDPKPYQLILEQGRANGYNEAVRTGTCRLGGREVWMAAFDFRFVGGSLSIVAGERLARGMEAAVADRLPYILVVASGGARMQEGVLALMQMAKINAAAGRLHAAGLPFFSILTDPTYGGTAASLAMVADVNIAEPAANIGFTGPRVIKQATYEDLPPDFQTADFQLAHGQVDMVVQRTELRPLLAHLIDIYTGVQ